MRGPRGNRARCSRRLLCLRDRDPAEPRLPSTLFASFASASELYRSHNHHLPTAGRRRCDARRLSPSDQALRHRVRAARQFQTRQRSARRMARPPGLTWRQRLSRLVQLGAAEGGAAAERLSVDDGSDAAGGVCPARTGQPREPAPPASRWPRRATPPLCP